MRRMQGFIRARPPNVQSGKRLGSTVRPLGWPRVVDGRGRSDQFRVITKRFSLGLVPLLLTIAALAGPTTASASTDCPNADLVPTVDNGPELRTATLCLLNEERASRGLKPLKSSTALRRAAQKHSLLMVRERFFDHVSPNGSTLLNRVKRGTSYLRGALNFTLGENIAWGSGHLATPQQTVETWMNSAPHRRNILNRRFRHVGVGVAMGAPEDGIGDAAATYTTDFGTRA